MKFLINLKKKPFGRAQVIYGTGNSYLPLLPSGSGGVWKCTLHRTWTHLKSLFAFWTALFLTMLCIVDNFYMFESPRNIRKDALNIQTWIHNKLRREGDSNPRYVSVHNLSKIAPSTTRTSLQNAVLMAYTILEKKRFVFSSSEFTTRLNSLSPHRVAHAQNAAHCSRLSHRSFRFKSLHFYKTTIQILKLIWISETKRIWTSGLQIRNLTLYPAEL